MYFRRAAAFLPVLFVACSFPDYQFDDKRFNAQQGIGGEGGLGGEGGTDASGGKGGKGGSGAKGGGAGSGGDAGNGEGGDAGTGGSAGNPDGGSGGVSGSASGASGAGGGTAGAGTGGGSGTGGMAGTSSGAGGTAGTGGSAGSAAGTGGAGGGTGPAGTCKTAADCKTNETCSTRKTIGTETYLTCFAKNPDVGALKPGAVCDDGSDCESFRCVGAPDADKGTCFATCGTNADCVTGAVCFDANLSQNSSVRVCAPGCLSDAGCDPALGLSCALYEDTITSTVAFACRSIGGVGFGLEPPPGQGCKSSVLIGTKCTKPCESDAECAAPFPSCKSGPIGTASGGEAVIKVCTT